MVCKTVNVIIENDMIIKFECESKVINLNIEMQDQELKGNRLLGFKSFFIDGQEYPLRKYYDVTTDKIKMPKPAMGKHRFELSNSFCSRIIEIKANTDLIKISCLK